MLKVLCVSDWLSHWCFSSKSSKHHKSQTIRARELKFWHNVQHLSHIACHVSLFMCHMSHVTCHMSHVFLGGASQWRVCYQLGRPREVLVITSSVKFDWNELITLHVITNIDYNQQTCPKHRGSSTISSVIKKGLTESPFFSHGFTAPSLPNCLRLWLQP